MLPGELPSRVLARTHDTINRTCTTRSQRPPDLGRTFERSEREAATLFDEYPKASTDAQRQKILDQLGDDLV